MNLTLTSAVLVAQVGEPPDVSETDGEADAGEKEVDLARPGFSLRLPVSCRLSGFRLDIGIGINGRRADVYRRHLLVVAAGAAAMFLF